VTAGDERSEHDSDGLASGKTVKILQGGPLGRGYSESIAPNQAGVKPINPERIRGRGFLDLPVESRPKEGEVSKQPGWIFNPEMRAIFC
jgi:hypothetical protein